MTVKEIHYWKIIKRILFLLNYILFIIKICQMCKIKSHWMFSVVFFMSYICVICDCVCILKYAIYLIWPRQFSFGPDSSHLAHVFLIWLIPWPEQKMSQRGPCQGRGWQPLGDGIFMSTGTSCHFGHLLQVLKTISLKSDFMQFFHDFIHVYSPGAGADSPQGSKF